MLSFSVVSLCIIAMISMSNYDIDSYFECVGRNETWDYEMEFLIRFLPSIDDFEITKSQFCDNVMSACVDGNQQYETFESCLDFMDQNAIDARRFYLPFIASHPIVHCDWVGIW
jgi:hypothetical protein